jgi:CRISPR/Cas system CMR subunit Cmr4 (Cas7 group RAMP superfamily)
MTKENGMLARIYWIHALTPLHVGAGSGGGFIDLPIMREKTTAWPVVPGTAVKGVLADDGGKAEERKKNPLRRAAFGISESSESGIAGFWRCSSSLPSGAEPVRHIRLGGISSFASTVDERLIGGWSGAGFAGSAM